MSVLLDALLTNMPKGLLVTLTISIGAIVSTFLVGIPLGVLSSFSDLSSRLVAVYVGFSRTVPVVITVYFAFFILPLLGIYLNPIFTVIVGLMLWGSANLAEIVRGAIQSIPREQEEAGQALGLTYRQIMVLVILPQATRRMIPSAVGILVILVQATALASAVGVQDFLHSASGAISLLLFQEGSSYAFEVYGVVMVVYFILSFPITLLARRLERKLAV